MACTPDELINAARCMSCLAPVQHLEIQTYLLCLIALEGGGGGGGTIQVYTYSTTDPTADGVTPADTTKAAIAYKDDGAGSMFVWNITAQAWV